MEKGVRWGRRGVKEAGHRHKERTYGGQRVKRGETESQHFSGAVGQALRANQALTGNLFPRGNTKSSKHELEPSQPGPDVEVLLCQREPCGNHVPQ